MEEGLFRGYFDFDCLTPFCMEVFRVEWNIEPFQRIIFHSNGCYIYSTLIFCKIDLSPILKIKKKKNCYIDVKRNYHFRQGIQTSERSLGWTRKVIVRIDGPDARRPYSQTHWKEPVWYLINFLYRLNI